MLDNSKKPVVEIEEITVDTVVYDYLALGEDRFNQIIEEKKLLLKFADIRSRMLVAVTKLYIEVASAIQTLRTSTTLTDEDLSKPISKKGLVLLDVIRSMHSQYKRVKDKNLELVALIDTISTINKEVRAKEIEQELSNNS